MASEDKEPTLPLEILKAVKMERPADATRRCFICLTDEDPSDTPGDWVDPCPCTLEAHQDCMLSWVLDCERRSKPLVCPVCKSAIEMEGPRDLLVAFNDLVQKRFTKTSPYVLLTGVSMGVQFSLQMYGALALWSFAGKNTMMRFLLGPDMIIDVKNGGGVRFIRERIWSSLVMMNVAPTLLFGQLFPNLSNKIFLPTASLYGMYQIMHDDTFFSWPPSPQLAMTVFPYVRSVYYNLWREFVLPYETKLNRQILGLPPAAPNNDARQDANQRRQAQPNGEGAIVGLLQGLIDALDPNDDDDDLQIDDVDRIELMDGEAGNDGEEQGREFIFERRIGEVGHAEGDFNGAGEGAGEPAEENIVHVEVEPNEADENAGDHPGQGEWQDEAGFDIEFQRHGGHLDQEDAPEPLPALGEGQEQEIEGAVAANDGQEQDQHEAPQAPPARRMGLGGLLSSVSNSVVSALILPGVSFGMGEALRLVLPKAWTASASRSPWALYAGPGGRPGLLQQQWGRSFIGGCLFVVIKDAIRVYAKSRRVAAIRNRRVKNVDRKRREK
ncbi:hypothetical protein EsDP_00003436 [Epichloe bromicola]|uniref:RING-CH-type domain-containing protein n=1 Tax=Epichloe bromicola TaxID=79588 RepID=A0ABQ0CNS5_9HYPO